MKILTLNTWQQKGSWQDRWEVILEGVEKYDPDILCFQEVFNPFWAQEVKKRTKMPEMLFPSESEGLLLLTRFPILRSDYLVYPTKSPTEDYRRGLVFAELAVGGARVAVLTTHLSWQLDEGQVREKQVGELIDFIDEKAGVGEAVVMGDFNAPPSDPEIRKMGSIGKFHDTFASLNRKAPGLTWENKNPHAASASHRLPDRRIDYIFVRNAATVLGKLVSVEVIFKEPNEKGLYASDHYGLLATFEDKIKSQAA